MAWSGDQTATCHRIRADDVRRADGHVRVRIEPTHSAICRAGTASVRAPCRATRACEGPPGATYVVPRVARRTGGCPGVLDRHSRRGSHVDATFRGGLGGVDWAGWNGRGEMGGVDWDGTHDMELACGLGQ